ncbi:hypothetical protein [Streptomyces sp. RP5T]|uniref:hypothetical protein n=1 Tax=Streptomyces sp. RP5T TaxID=2490848 RepID=UPI000F648DB1|nr:hypothetical protein [Streptomyces sp. RP5T]RRR82920.1 hypothetical protein EHS43_15495 [Streptomyces sp. RP5T]
MEDTVPIQFDPHNNPYSDTDIAKAYLDWVGQGGENQFWPPESDEENKLWRMPGRSVEVTISYGPPSPATKDVPIGAILHSYVHPANPGPGELTADTLYRAGAPLCDLGQLGTHIHVGALSSDQLAAWATIDDINEASQVHGLYEQRGVAEGHIPATVSLSDNRKKPAGEWEPQWSIDMRKAISFSRSDRRWIGPATAWALMDHGIEILKSSKGDHRLCVGPKSPLDSERVKTEKNSETVRSIAELYRQGVLDSGNLPNGPYITKTHNTRYWMVADSTKTAINRLAYLANPVIPLRDEEIPVLRDNFVPLIERDGATYVKQDVQKMPIGTIVDRLKEKYSAQVPALQQPAGQSRQPVFDQQYVLSQPGPGTQPSLRASGYQEAGGSLPWQSQIASRGGKSGPPGR